MDEKQFRDWVVECLSEIRSTLAAQHVTLVEHQRRSTANEEALERLRVEFKPVSLHVALVGAVAKVALGLGSLAAATLGVLRAFGAL